VPKRLIQLTVNDLQADELEAYCEPATILSITPAGLAENRLMAQMVVDTDATEKVLDSLERVYGTREGFLVTMLPIEATLPRPPEPEPDQAALAGETAGKRISREELYQEMSAGLRVRSTFVAFVTLSSLVAAIGLYRSDLAILVGAMVIAPLLTPNMALSLAATLGDGQLAKRAASINLLGVSLSLVIAIACGFLLAITPDTPAIASRSHIGAGDLVLALASGAAGALAFTTGMSSALIGVMVAVALMPPLVAFGMLLGAGYLQASTGPLLLLSTNVICLNLAGVATFVAKGIRPRTWWEAKKAKTATRVAAMVWGLLLLGLIAILWNSGNFGF